MNKVTMNKRPVEEISEVEPPLKKFVEYHGNKENNPRNSSSLIISTDPFDDDSGFLEDKIVSHKPISLKQSTPFIKKQKRVRLNIEDQYKVLDMYDKTKNAEQIAKDTKIPKSTVWNIIRRRPKIEGVMSYGSKKYVKTVKSVREATHPDVDKAVWLWFLGERKRASIISNEILMAQARYFHENLCDKDDFKGSRGWCRAFKLKRGIRQLKITGEKLSADVSAVEPFKKKFAELITSNNYLPEQIYNADESALYWKGLPKSTLVAGGEKGAPGSKANMERITITPCANLTATHKLPLQIIGRAKMPRCFKKTPISKNIHYCNSKNAWQTQYTFNEYFHSVFVPHVRKFSAENNIEAKAVLLLDNASGHNDTDDHLVSDDGLIRCYYLPPNVTSLLQPMDQHVILPVKTHYRKDLLREMILSGKSKKEFLQDMTLSDCVRLIEKAWNSLDKSIIIQSWKALLCDTPFYQNLLMNDQKSDYISEDFKSIVRLLEKVSIHVPNNVGPENIMEWLNRMDENQTHVIYDKTEILNLIKGIKPSSTHEEENDDSQEDFINDSSKMNDDNITIVETDEYRLKEKKEGRKALESLEHLENYFKDRNSHSNVLILNKLREEIEENIFSVYIDEI